MSNVAILINTVEETITTQILEIAKKVKSLKIITNNINKFIYMEEELYINYGIAIQVTNNKNKALQNSEIIINIDFEEHNLNLYNIKDDATIINIKKKITKISNEFKGIIINDYKIKYNEEIFNDIKEKNDFDENVLYESLIYRKDTFSHIKEQLEKDNIELKELFQTK